MAHKTVEEHRAHREGRAREILKQAGYKVGGKVTPESAVHKHEHHLHKGEKPTKFKSGGKVGGKGAKHHAGHKARSPHIHINIMSGDPMEKQQAAQQGMAVGARLGAAAAARHMAPPMPPPGAGPIGPGPGGPPPMPPRPPVGAPMGGPPMRRGGKVKGYEGSKADIKEDKREAKKHHMTMKEWEGSEMDKREDAKHEKHAKHKKYARGGHIGLVGAGSGEGRLAKIAAYGGNKIKVKAHLRSAPHKSGGAC